MSLTEYLSIPFLISLGITLLLVGIVGMFFTQRLQEQNHKINSIIGLVTTMAEEMNYLRAKTAANPNIELNNKEGGSASEFASASKSEELLLVSDGEDDDSDESDDDEDDEDDEDDDEETEAEAEQDDELLDISEVKDSSENVKLINIFSSLSNDEVEISNLNEIYDNADDDSSDSDSEELVSVSNETINLVELDSNTDIDINALNSSLINRDEKVLSIDLNTVDYKKFSITQLRNIVSEKGLSDDPTKLKKNDLIKLLEG
uniref:Rho termination factor N-terminal domain-containing protein n=1 Tax=viral metagenome TaxID=1070528 RepID=A0A6C0KVQ4_9ZZZZ